MRIIIEMSSLRSWKKHLINYISVQTTKTMCYDLPLCSLLKFQTIDPSWHCVISDSTFLTLSHSCEDHNAGFNSKACGWGGEAWVHWEGGGGEGGGYHSSVDGLQPLFKVRNLWYNLKNLWQLHPLYYFSLKLGGSCIQNCRIICAHKSINVDHPPSAGLQKGIMTTAR